MYFYHVHIRLVMSSWLVMCWKRNETGVRGQIGAIIWTPGPWEKEMAMPTDWRGSGSSLTQSVVCPVSRLKKCAVGEGSEPPFVENEGHRFKSVCGVLCVTGSYVHEHVLRGPIFIRVSVEQSIKSSLTQRKMHIKIGFWILPLPVLLSSPTQHKNTDFSLALGSQIL